MLVAAAALAGLAGPAPAMDGPLLTISDGTDDVDSEPAVPGAPTGGFLDLERVELTDDDRALSVRIFVNADLEAWQPDVVQSLEGFVNSHEGDYYIFFGIGLDTYRIQADVRADADVARPDVAPLSIYEASVCRLNDRGYCGGSSKRIGASVNAVDDFVLLRVPKESIEATDPLRPQRGDALSGIYAASEGTRRYGLFASVGQTDRAPDEGEAGPYALHHASTNRNIQLLVTPSMESIPVQRGPNVFDLNVTNRVPEKRILRLEADGSQDANASHFEVVLPNAVTLPAQQTRVVKLFLNVSQEAAYGTTLALELGAQSVAFPDELALIVQRLVVSPTLTPQEPFLYLHARHRNSGGMIPEPIETTFCQQNEALLRNPCLQAFLSPLRDAPNVAEGDQISMSSGYFQVEGGASVWATLNAGLGSPVALDTTRPAWVNLTVNHWRDLPPTTATVRLSYRTPTGADGLVAEGSGDFVLSEQDTVSSIELKFKRNAPAVWPRGTTVTLTVDAQVPQESRVGPLPKVRGGESHVRLPVVELPQDLIATEPITLQMLPLDERERFVNPGEVQLYRISLLSQAPGPQRVSLRVDELPPGWSATLEPGDRFDLQPGDTIGLAVRLTASPTVTEGAVVRFNLTAIDEAGREVRLWLRATAVTSIDTEDQSAHREQDEDARARLVQEAPPQTPGFLWILALAALLGGARMRRRS